MDHLKDRLRALREKLWRDGYLNETEGREFERIRRVVKC